MNAHGIINGIVVFVIALLLIGQIIKKLGASTAKVAAPAPGGTGAPVPAAAPPSALVPRKRLTLAGPEPFAARRPAAPAAPQLGRVGAIPRQARDDMRSARDDMRSARDDMRSARDDMRSARDDMGAADAFPGLDLTLPDADAPGVLVKPTRAGRTFRGNVMPGERGWGTNAVVALEILGPPVSLRSGATLGAPHAF